MAVTTLIVEDEPLARERLRAFVAAHDDLELVGEAVDGDTAIRLIDALRPDLVFLDIELPGPKGLDVLQRVRHRPEIIVTTAFEKYAVGAFEIGAVDFLLKPYSPMRFRTAVERVLRVRREPEAESRGQGGGSGQARVGGTVQWAVARAAAPPPVLYPADLQRPLRRIFVPERKRSVPLPVSEIRRLEARDDYVAVYDGRRSYLIRARLRDLEARLDPEDFVRVHRSHIVNLNHVSAILPHPGGRLLIEMNDGSRIVASRAHSAELRRRMG